MKQLLKDVLSELKLILTGRTIDAILPPLVFYASYRLFGIEIGVITALIFALLILIFNLTKHQKTTYAWIGFLGVMFASVVAYLNQNPSTYFLADILSNAFVMLFAIYSLIIKKPLAAYLSHLTRGWPMDWFLRDDVKPAYKEVTYLWLLLFMLRTTIEVWIYVNGSVEDLLVFGVILGFPLFILVLTISYIYGIWRLRTLKGPGVDEFIAGKEPPYRGQVKGF